MNIDMIRCFYFKKDFFYIYINEIFCKIGCFCNRLVDSELKKICLYVRRISIDFRNEL